jgi:hypothetical protein
MMADPNFDLTIGLLGRDVPLNSHTLYWKNGYKTVLPTVYDEHMVNVCAKVDIPIIKYLAQWPESSPHSIYTTHVTGRGNSTVNLHDVAGDALSQNKPIVIRGTGSYPASVQLTTDFLDRTYELSPHRAVWVHGSVVTSSAIDLRT